MIHFIESLDPVSFALGMCMYLLISVTSSLTYNLGAYLGLKIDILYSKHLVNKKEKK